MRTLALIQLLLLPLAGLVEAPKSAAPAVHREAQERSVHSLKNAATPAADGSCKQGARACVAR